MAAIVLEDYFKKFTKNKLSERTCSTIMRSTVLVFGALSVALVYVVERLGSVLQLSMSVPPACLGSIFGVYMIGMFIPWIGRRAAFYGALISSTVIIYIVVRSQLDISNGLLRFDEKITSVEGCSYNFTFIDEPMPLANSHKEFHHISYLYNLPLGALITCLAAFVLSFLFGFNDANSVDKSLLAPCMRKRFVLRTIQE